MDLILNHYFYHVFGLISNIHDSKSYNWEPIPLIGYQILKGKQFVANGGHSNDVPLGHYPDLKIKFSKRHLDPASIWTTL